MTNDDRELQEFVAGVGKLREQGQALSPVEYCRAFWALLRPLYVFEAGADGEG